MKEVMESLSRRQGSRNEVRRGTVPQREKLQGGRAGI